MAPPTGLKEISRLYPGFTPGATNVPPLWGLLLWLRIRICWIWWMGRIDFWGGVGEAVNGVIAPPDRCAIVKGLMGRII